MSTARRTVVVTGASGTLGFNIVRLLVRDPHVHVVIPVRKLLHCFTLFPNIEMELVDLTEPLAAEALVSSQQPYAIIHCAASGVRPERPIWSEMTAFNVQATIRLFEAACRIQQCHFIYVSTGLIYQQQNRPLSEADPVGTLNPYAASKVGAECILQACATESQRPLTIVRPFSFTGLHDGGSRLFPSLLKAARANQPVRLSPGQQCRDFCSVQDIAQAVITILARKQRQLIEIFNLGSGDSKTLRSTIEDVCQEIGLRTELQFGERPYQPYEPMHLVADIKRATTLPWRPATNLAYAVWELAKSEFPELKLRQPEAYR
jgi:UDP-glucose 4-epimerase